MTPIEMVLSRLEHVKQRKESQWSAKCPAHEDNSPSLSVRQTDEGSVLVHCFGGCSFAEIFSSINLEPSHAYPPRHKSGFEPKRTPKLVTPGQALEIVAGEAFFAAVCASDLSRGKALAESDLDRLHKSAGRIVYAMTQAGVRASNANPRGTS
jgi:hypothetical protein